MTLIESFNEFRAMTDDIPAAILAIGSLLIGEQVATKPLRVKEAAELLRVSTDAVYSLCDSGKLRHHRIGKGRGTIRILPADLMRLQNEAA